MKNKHLFLNSIFACCLIFWISCSSSADRKHVINFTYTNLDIQKQFDTLYNNQVVEGKGGSILYKGFIEQASAVCHDSAQGKTAMQDVVSSMYLDTTTQKYNCVTTTVFHLQDGDITALGLFKLMPGDTIAPNHDFPITGGTGLYANSFGTYTRHYMNGIYYVELRYLQR